MKDFTLPIEVTYYVKISYGTPVTVGQNLTISHIFGRWYMIQDLLRRAVIRAWRKRNPHRREAPAPEICAAGIPGAVLNKLKEQYSKIFRNLAAYLVSPDKFKKENWRLVDRRILKYLGRERSVLREKDSQDGTVRLDSDKPIQSIPGESEQLQSPAGAGAGGISSTGFGMEYKIPAASFSLFDPLRGINIATNASLPGNNP